MGKATMTSAAIRFTVFDPRFPFPEMDYVLKSGDKESPLLVVISLDAVPRGAARAGGDRGKPADGPADGEDRHTDAVRQQWCSSGRRDKFPDGRVDLFLQHVAARPGVQSHLHRALPDGVARGRRRLDLV